VKVVKADDHERHQRKASSSSQKPERSCVLKFAQSSSMQPARSRPAADPRVALTEVAAPL
jgi:hypothetical protein